MIAHKFTSWIALAMINKALVNISDIDQTETTKKLYDFFSRIKWHKTTISQKYKKAELKLWKHKSNRKKKQMKIHTS